MAKLPSFHIVRWSISVYVILKKREEVEGYTEPCLLVWLFVRYISK